MTKAGLIKAILEQCATRINGGRNGARKQASRSPAAGGGMTGEAPRVRRRRSVGNPQTGERRGTRRRSRRGKRRA